jgi:hypothetical protein
MAMRAILDAKNTAVHSYLLRLATTFVLDFEQQCVVDVMKLADSRLLRLKSPVIFKLATFFTGPG